MQDFKTIIAAIGYAIESVGVLVIVIGSIYAGVVLVRHWHSDDAETSYRRFRKMLGRSIILGLEFLIAGDIIRTVIVSDTLENIAILGVIILIRTFLSITLFLEVEGRWPWESARESKLQQQ